MSNIRDIAKLAGVSVATVSRVLNHDTTYKMKEETREKVWKAVAETGYHLPKAPKKKNSSREDNKISIGCIINITKDKYRDPYFMNVLSGVEHAVDEKGFSLAFVVTYGELKDRPVLYELFNKPLSGIIIMENMDNETYGFIKSRVPNCVGVDTKYTDIDDVSYDHFSAGFNATRHLIEMGHKKIGFIGGSGFSHNIKDSRRFWGYRCAMELENLFIDESWIHDCCWEEQKCIDCTRKIMKLPEGRRPTALFVGSDLMAIASLSCLYSLGIKVPKQIAVMGLSNIEASSFSSPPLSTIDVPTFKIGELAVEVLERRINGSEMPPQQIYLPAYVLKRNST